ncbi:MAG TPA: peptidylprolyl isomerase [Verrucomicrobiae bacterium]
MKLKLIRSTMLAAVVAAGMISAQAATMPSGASATNSNPVDAMTALFGDPVIAKGTGFEIKRSDLDKLVDEAKANAAGQSKSLPPGYQIGILDQLIAIQMLVQKATPADQAAGKIDADMQFTNLLEHFGSQEALTRQLTAVGITEQELRRKATQEAVAKATLQRELNLNITDAMCQDYYSNHTAMFEEPEKAHVQHILLMTMDPATRTPLSTNAVAAKRKQIDDLLKRIKAGEDFGALAKQYSEDPGSKTDGGELPKFSRGEMVPEFEAAAFALKPGQISDVISTAYGFHIIKMLDLTPAKKYGFTDEIPEINQTVAAYCKNRLEAEQMQKLAPAYMQKLRTEEKVQILDPDLKAMEQSMLDAETNAPAEN